jgi:cation transport regulator ChaC
MTRIAVFAYGSLVDPSSAAQTLGRAVDISPARLRGWRRRWSQARDNLTAEKTFAIEPGGELPPWILGLNVEQDPSATPDEGPNGVLIEVTEAELAGLDRRELRYDRVEVSISAFADRFETIFTYTAKPVNFAPTPPPGAVILAAYARTVERAFAALGAAELETYLTITGEPPVDLVDATLVRDDIPPGNPREW